MPHDETAEWTTAPLAEDTGESPLALGAAPWPGQVLRTAAGDSVYVRRTDGPVGGPQSWYIHGLGASSTNWTPLAGLLRAESTGMSVDLPGNGRSDPPPRGDYSVRHHVDLLAALITERADAPVHLVGNSYGGFLAVLLAARIPDRIRSLTLISPAVPDLRLRGERGADPRLAILLAPGTIRAAEPRLAAISVEDRVAGIAQLCFGNPDLVTPEDLIAAVGDLGWRRDLPWAQTAMLEELRGLMHGYLRPGKASWWARAAAITVPTLVIWGTRDRLVDVRLARRTAEVFPDSRLLVLKGVGHAAHMEDPVSTGRAVRALWADS
ncbi:alpha/beta hydrolase [Nakamurella silvestris]|nr:alpha/beta hydrolase [Nakamurella silvestris]